MGMATRAEKKLRKMRKAALGASKGLVVAGKLASASGATGVGRKLQAGRSTAPRSLSARSPENA